MIHSSAVWQLYLYSLSSLCSLLLPCLYNYRTLTNCKTSRPYSPTLKDRLYYVRTPLQYYHTQSSLHPRDYTHSLLLPQDYAFERRRHLGIDARRLCPTRDYTHSLLHPQDYAYPSIAPITSTKSSLLSHLFSRLTTLEILPENVDLLNPPLPIRLRIGAKMNHKAWRQFPSKWTADL
jgi:hypothetical protein